MMTLHRTRCVAIGCLVAASSSASAFVPSPYLESRALAGFGKSPSSLCATTDDKDALPSDSAIAEQQRDGLNQDKFLEDMDEELPKLPFFARDVTAPPSPSSSSSSSSSFWKFRGHDVYHQISLPTKPRQPEGGSAAPVVLLVHGFGCSSTYWRETSRALTSEGYEVHAIDLLGQGRSAKATSFDVEYSVNLWARQIDEYSREKLAGRDVVIVGNSVGSLVGLTAATGDFLDDDADGDDGCYLRERVVGLGMFNCGIGMNVRNMSKDPKWNPIQRFALNLAFDWLEEFVFGNAALLTWVLDEVVSRDALRNVLKELYACAPDPEARVDDELVDSFYLPARERGSPEVLRRILTGDAGRTPVELHEAHGEFLRTLPIHLVWGDADTVVPLEWQVGQFYSELAAEDDNAVSMDVVHGGHVLFDEVPDVANGSMLSWLNSMVSVTA